MKRFAAAVAAFAAFGLPGLASADDRLAKSKQDRWSFSIWQAAWPEPECVESGNNAPAGLILRRSYRDQEP